MPIYVRVQWGEGRGHLVLFRIQSFLDYGEHMGGLQ